jgi:hypothetical protein
MVMVDCPEMRESNAKEIAVAIRTGWLVERVTCEEVRKGPPGRCEEHAAGHAGEGGEESTP